MDFENFLTPVDHITNILIQLIYLEDSIFVYIGDKRGELNNMFLAIKTKYVSF